MPIVAHTLADVGFRSPCCEVAPHGLCLPESRSSPGPLEVRSEQLQVRIRAHTRPSPRAHLSLQLLKPTVCTCICSD